MKRTSCLFEKREGFPKDFLQLYLVFILSYCLSKNLYKRHTNSPSPNEPGFSMLCILVNEGHRINPVSQKANAKSS